MSTEKLRELYYRNLRSN